MSSHSKANAAEIHASESIATRFTRPMNASTSRYGVLADLSLSAALSALPTVLLVHELASRELQPLWMYGLITLAAAPVLISLIVGFALRRARSDVVRWLAPQPFPIENMNALLVGLGDMVEVMFAKPLQEPGLFAQTGMRSLQAGSKLPTREQMQPLLDRISDDMLYTGAFEEEQRVEIKIGVFESKAFPSRSNYLRYQRFRCLIEEVLVPLHRECPIAWVRIR